MKTKAQTQKVKANAFRMVVTIPLPMEAAIERVWRADLGVKSRNEWIVRALVNAIERERK